MAQTSFSAQYRLRRANEHSDLHFVDADQRNSLDLDAKKKDHLLLREQCKMLKRLCAKSGRSGRNVAGEKRQRQAKRSRKSP